MSASPIRVRMAGLIACTLCAAPSVAMEQPSGSLLVFGGIKQLSDFDDDLTTQWGTGLLFDQAINDSRLRFAAGLLYNGEEDTDGDGIGKFTTTVRMFELQIGLNYAVVGDRFGFYAGAGPELAWTRYQISYEVPGSPDDNDSAVSGGWGFWTHVGAYARLGSNFSLGGLLGYTLTQNYIGEGDDDKESSSGLWGGVTLGLVW